MRTKIRHSQAIVDTADQTLSSFSTVSARFRKLAIVLLLSLGLAALWSGCALAAPPGAPPPNGDDATGCGAGDDAPFVTTHAYCEKYLRKWDTDHPPVQNQLINQCVGERWNDGQTGKCTMTPTDLANRKIKEFCGKHPGLDCGHYTADMQQAISYCLRDIGSAARWAGAMRGKLSSATQARMMKQRYGSIISDGDINTIVAVMKSTEPRRGTARLYTACLNHIGIAYNPF